MRRAVWFPAWSCSRLLHRPIFLLATLTSSQGRVLPMWLGLLCLQTPSSARESLIESQYPFISEDGKMAESSFLCPSVQPTLYPGALILTPYRILICAEGQLLFPSRGSGNNASAVASAMGTGVELWLPCLWVAGLKDSSVHWSEPRVFSIHTV